MEEKFREFINEVKKKNYGNEEFLKSLLKLTSYSTVEEMIVRFAYLAGIEGENSGR